MNITIGVVFIFLIFGVAVSAVNEGIASVLAIRAKALWAALATIAGAGNEPDPATPKTHATSLIGTKSIAALLGTKGDKRPTLDATENPAADPGSRLVAKIDAKTKGFKQGTSKTRVSNIPARVVSESLLEMGTEALGDAAAAAATGKELLDAVQQAVAGTPLAAPVAIARKRADGDVAKFATEIETWFDARMDALSGLYKRQSRWVMLVIALIIAFLFDVNPIVAVSLLRNDSALAATTASEAAAFVHTTTQKPLNCSSSSSSTTTTTGGTTSTTTPLQHAQACYSTVQDAIGQARKLPPPLDFSHVWEGSEPSWEYWVGCLLGAIAISFGAPFWYDLLRKIISLRGGSA